MKFYLPPSTIRQYAVVLIVNLSVFTSGMNLSWPSPMLVKLRNATETPLSRPLTEEEGSWMVSLGSLLGIAANIVGGLLLDSVGRKYCILLASLPKVLMGFVCIYATEVWMLVVGRTVLSMVDGVVFTTVSVYASEIAAKENRGVLGTLLQIFSSLGIVVSLSVGPFTSYTTFNILFTSLNAITMLPLIFLPQSPQFLYSKGRVDEAKNILTNIRGSDAAAMKEIEEYSLLQSNNTKKISKLGLFKNKTFQKSLALSLLISMGGQIVGFNAVSFYLQTILISTNISIKPESASVVMGVIQVIAAFCAMPITSKFGRKTILLWSLTGYFLGMLGLGTFFTISEPKHYQITGFMNYLPILSLIIAIYCYSAGIGSLYWLIIAELFDGEARAVGVSMSLMTTGVFLFLITKYFFFMTTMLGPSGTYWFFSTMTVIFTSLLAIFLPETKGKTFAEIQRALGGESAEVQEKSEKGNLP